MDIQLQGKVDQILQEQSGQGKNGTWRKRDFILEIPGKYPKKVCITQWGDNIDSNPIQQGEQVTVSVDIQSREYKGNWYTDVKAWKIAQGTAPQQGEQAPPPPSAEGFTIDTQEFNDMDDDLPF